MPTDSKRALCQYPVIVACLSAHLGSLDSAINISFPSITAAFALPVTAIQWVVIGYVLTHASLLLGCGGLADRYGHGRLLAWGLTISAGAFAGCGLATHYSWLVAFRILQGLGAALIFGSAPALVTLAVAADQRGRALGIYQMSTAIGYAFGPLIGGMLVDLAGWRVTFLFRLPAALLLAWLAAKKCPAPSERRETQRFDSLGALTLAASIAGCLLALGRSRALGSLSPQVVLLGFASIACFAGFLVIEKRSSAPVVDLALFRNLGFVIANLLSVLANCARFAIGLLLPYYLINVLRYPATVGGSLMLATYVLTILAAPLAGKWSDRIGTARLAALGLAVEGLGLWLLSRLDEQAAYLELATTLAVVGLGLGIFEAPNMSFVMGSIPRSQQGVAGSIASMMRPLGIVAGASGWSLLFDLRRAADSAPTASAFQDVFFGAAMLCGLAWLLSLFRKEGRIALGVPRQGQTDRRLKL